MKTTVGGVLAFAITLLVSLPSTLAVPAVPQGPGPTPTDLPDPSSPTTARYSLLIDDMENVTDWLALGPNISLSSDRTQGNYSLNMSGLTNGSFYLAAKNITAMGIDATRYDALEFDLKVSKKEYAIFLAGFDDPPAYDRAGWYRTYRDAGVWHHAVLPFAEQQRALGGAKIGEEYALFLFAGHPDFGSKPVWFHVDNLKLTGSGLRITAPSYACADPSGNTAIAVKASHLLGGAAETLRLELDRTTLGPFRSSSPDIERFGVPVGGSFAANFSFEAPVDLPQDSSWKIAFNLTSTSDPAKRTRAEITLGTWTPLQRIYFLSDKDREENEIYSMNPDGTGIERLTNNTVYEHEPLSLSGDGRRLAFARKVTQNDQDFELWWINTTTRQEFRLTTNSTYEVHPDWSGDGKWLTFFGMQGIGKVRDDGTGYTLLSTSIAADPAFSRDSKRIAHNGWPGVVGDMKDVELYMMDADGKNRTRLTTNNLTETDPYWARDDSDFLFDRYNGFGQWNNLSHSIGEPWGIYRWDIASGKETELFNGTGPNWLPTYSPDNRRVSFLHQNETIGIHRLRFMDPDGSNLTELALPYHVMWHDWGVREPVQVDLAVRDLRITPSPPKANQTANLSVVVENRGKVATSATLQLFDGPRDDRYPSLLARIQLPPVAAGSSVNVTSPFVAAKGNRTSWARVESVGQWDIVPGNNVTRVDYEAAPPVTTLKDLAVLQGKLIVSPPSPDENSLISITTSVKNLGTANAT
ncbi:MAG TPA: hypothetical protein VI893_05865, partial [Thermoplasmata archaeon]|nr:hypothetical protein [Thermoplasmata archaeon]